jgi:hypothetical protein
MYPIRETPSQRYKIQIVCENYMFSFHHVLGSSESRWRCINKTCKAFILTVGEGNERIFSSGKFSHVLSFVRSLVHSKKGNFLERAEIRAPLIPLPASVRSFESPRF